MSTIYLNNNNFIKAEFFTIIKKDITNIVQKYLIKIKFFFNNRSFGREPHKTSKSNQ